MNLQAIESVVRRLFADADFRAEALADPSKALEEYRLAADERAALAKLCLQMAGGAGVLERRITVLGFWWC